MVVGFEDTVTSLRLVMSGLTTRTANIKVIVPHPRRHTALLMQRIEDSVMRRILRGVEPKTKVADLIRGLYFDTVNNYSGALRCSCEAFGSDHIMLGPTFPT